MLAIKLVVTGEQWLNVILEDLIEIKLVGQREGVVEAFGDRVG